MDDLATRLQAAELSQHNWVSFAYDIAEITYKHMQVHIRNVPADGLPAQLNDLKVCGALRCCDVYVYMFIWFCQSFRERILPLQHYVEQINETAARITNGNVLLPHDSLKRLDELNGRFRLLQNACEERQQHVELAIMEHGSIQQQFLASVIDGPWERAVAPNNVPYYIKSVIINLCVLSRVTNAYFLSQS